MDRLAAVASLVRFPLPPLSPRARARLLLFTPLIACWLVAALLVVAARAAEPGTPPDTVVDFGPLVVSVLEIFGPTIVVAMGSLGAAVLWKLWVWLGLKQDAEHRAAIEQGFDKAVGLALTRLGDRAAGGIPIALKNEAIATVADYAAKTLPRALEHFRKSGADIAEMAEARLENVLVDPKSERLGTAAVSGRLAG